MLAKIKFAQIYSISIYFCQKQCYVFINFFFRLLIYFLNNLFFLMDFTLVGHQNKKSQIETCNILNMKWQQILKQKQSFINLYLVCMNLGMNFIFLRFIEV